MLADGYLTAILTISLLRPDLLAVRDPEMYDLRFVQNLTRNLFFHHKLECFVTFSSSRKRLPLFPDGISRTLDRFLFEDLNRPLIVWGLESNVSLDSILTSHTMAFAGIRDLRPEREPILEVIDKALYGRHDVRVLFVLKSREMAKPTRKQIYEFFAWCWRRKFINVALTYQQRRYLNETYSVDDELITYTPFPEVTIRNVTSLGVMYNWELIDVGNVHGYEFRVPVFQEFGMAFLLPNGSISGAVGKLVTTFISQCHGRIKIERTPHVNKHNYHNHTLTWATRGIIDIGVHPFTHMTIGSDQVDGLMTMSYARVCLMVPMRTEFPLHRFFRFSIRCNGVFYLVLVVVLALGWQLIASDWQRGVLYAATIFNLQSANGRAFRSFPSSHKMLYVGLLLGAYLLWTIRLAYMSSAFAHKVGPPQIRNLADFLSDPIPIMATETEVEMVFRRASMPKALRPHVVIVDARTLQEHLNNLNTSYAYFSGFTLWNIVQFQQSRLRYPLFHRLMPSICTLDYIRMIPMQRNSPFREKFLEFYIQTLLSGFYQKWRTLSVRQLIQSGYIHIFQDVDNGYSSIDFNHIQIMIKCYSVCISVCILCLLCEIAWNKLFN